MTLANALRQATRTWRNFGPSAALHEARQRAINRVIPFSILECARLRLSDVDPRFLDAGRYRAGFARSHEMLAAAGEEYDLPADFVAEAFAKGDECFTVHDGERLASYGWFAKRPTPIDDELVFHFDPGWVHNYKVFTHPDYRGKRLYPIQVTLAIRAYAAAGMRGVVSYVRSTNFPSQRTRAHTGQRKVGEIYILRVGSRWLIWSTPGCRPYGFRVATVTARNTLDPRA